MKASSWRLVWSPAAEDDLGEIWNYYSQVASLEVAEKLVREIEIAADRAADNPLLWQLRQDIVPRLPGGLRSIPLHPYIIFYQLHEDELRIVRVLHQRRDVASILADEESRPN